MVHRTLGWPTQISCKWAEMSATGTFYVFLYPDAGNVSSGTRQYRELSVSEAERNVNHARNIEIQKEWIAEKHDSSYDM